MNFDILDWTIVIALLIVLTAAVVYIRRYNRSVSDFLSASRSANRYMLCVGDGIAGVCAISLIAVWEMYYSGGFPQVWWQTIMAQMLLPAFLGMTGFVFYRFRQTRVFTAAEFIERRYGSCRLRVFTGILFFFSGIVNFGIFPSVGARFFIYFMGMPDTIINHIVIMIILLGLALFITLIGGQIAVMVTDFIQGVFCNIAFVIILIFLFYVVSWDQIYQALTANIQEGASMIHPFKISGATEFTPIFYMVLFANMVYTFGSWQGNQGYKSAARNAHEARMGQTLVAWRGVIMTVFVIMIPIFAYTMMHHPDFASQVNGLDTQITQIADSKSEIIAKQVTPYLIMERVLPKGILGLLATVMLALFITTHDTYLHSWGSIFIQDVVIPIRKKPFEPKTHVLLLQLSIVFVAVFIFFFSLLFRQVEYIFMFFMVTGGIVGGFGAVQLGGLYWKKGSTSGAWLAMISGAVFSITAIILQQIHARVPFENEMLLYICTRSGLVLGVSAAVISLLFYITASLVVNKDHNMDKLLHQGKYTIDDDIAIGADTEFSTKGLMKKLGITKEFTKLDKIIYFAVMAWLGLLFGIFVVVSILNLVIDLDEKWWLGFWKYFIGLMLVLGTIFATWISLGGVIDARKMFRRLDEVKLDDSDDGTVDDLDCNITMKDTLSSSLKS